jgi:hypothetical protein
LILGANGAGKTNLFEVLARLRDVCIHGEPTDREFPAPRLVGRTLTRWQNLPGQTFELDVIGNGGKYSFKLVVDSWGYPEKPRIISEEVNFDDKPAFRFAKGEVHLYNDRHEDQVLYPFDWHRSALATITERPDNAKLSWFKRWLEGLLCRRWA